MSVPNSEKINLLVDTIIHNAVEWGANYIYLHAGRMPFIRGNDRMGDIKLAEPLCKDDIAMMMSLFVPQEKMVAGAFGFDFKAVYEHSSLTVEKHRFLVMGCNGPLRDYITLNFIDPVIPNAKDIGFPTNAWETIVKLRHGLVVVSGPPDSGKKKTVLSLLQHISRTREGTIITLEDTVGQLLSTDSKSLVSQRGYGEHFSSYADAMRTAIMEDCDVLYLDNVRDNETAMLALDAAKHRLVFANTEARRTFEAVRSYVKMCDEDLLARMSLCLNLAYVMCQEQIPYDRISERVLLMEIMNVALNPKVQSCIFKGEYDGIKHQFPPSNRGGSISMRNHLIRLVDEGAVEITERDQKNLF